MMVMRLVAAAAATTFIVISLRYVPLATVNTVLQVTPLLVTAGAAIFYGERVGLSRWLAALTGFLGVMLIVKPGNAVLGTAAYLVLVALAFTTLRDLTTRGLERNIPSIFVAAASAAAITLAGIRGGGVRHAVDHADHRGLGLDGGVGGVPADRQYVHHHRAAHRRDRGRRALSLCCGAAVDCDRLLVVGRYPGCAGVCRHRPGHRRRHLHACIGSGAA